jgi:hypothetical protein
MFHTHFHYEVQAHAIQNKEQEDTRSTFEQYLQRYF